jgi:NitT/TauT family transport system substrate-binding protein
MSTPRDRILFDKFVPDEGEMQYMADLMQHYGLVEANDISGLVYDQFARDVNLQDIAGLESILAM